jgi:hypothetical protein
MTRAEKIQALAAIQSGRGNIASLMDTVWEYWEASDKKPDLYVNEVTGQSLTASQLEVRGQARPYLKFFITQLSDPVNDPIL